MSDLYKRQSAVEAKIHRDEEDALFSGLKVKDNREDKQHSHFTQSEIKSGEQENDYRHELQDESELNNEGELIGYSEQIIGRINDMAPGIPNQDEVLNAANNEEEAGFAIQ